MMVPPRFLHGWPNDLIWPRPTSSPNWKLPTEKLRPCARLMAVVKPSNSLCRPLIGAQKGLNEVRYPSLPGIMKAKRKPLEVISLADLGLGVDDVAARVEMTTAELPPARKAGQKLSGEVDEVVAKLVQLLKEEAKVI